MIYIFTALYCEAYSVIGHFGLVKNNDIKQFQVFENKDSEIVLTVTGAGSIKAAVAVSSIGTYYGIGKNDFLMNIGICAGIPEDRNTDFKGRIYLCNKITERSTNRTFYPDVLFRHGFLEEEIVSVERPLHRKQEENQTENRTECEAYSLFDMEAAAVYQAGAYFLGPHSMSFLKVVSDDGNLENVTPAMAEKLINQNMESISEYIMKLWEWSRMEKEQDAVANENEKAWLSRVYSDMHCSDTMKAVLNQHIHYCILAGVDYKNIMEELYLQGKLPCSCKREGKLCFEELRKRLL